MEIVGVQIPPPAPQSFELFGKHRPSFMQVTETSAEGLKREFRVVVPAGELEEKVTSRLGEIGRTIQLRGFRPGKVPMQILRQRFGNSVRGEVLESTLAGHFRRRDTRAQSAPGVAAEGRHRLIQRGDRSRIQDVVWRYCRISRNRALPTSTSSGSSSRCPTRMSTVRSSESPSSSARPRSPSARPRAATLSWSISRGAAASRRFREPAGKTARSCWAPPASSPASRSS